MAEQARTIAEATLTAMSASAFSLDHACRPVPAAAATSPTTPPCTSPSPESADVATYTECFTDLEEAASYDEEARKHLACIAAGYMQLSTG
jgi:hypothetical protein